jgi:hypothetical protein
MPLPTEHAWRSPAEIARWAHQRLPGEREPVPQPGERLLFRAADFGDVVPAVVAGTQDMSVPGDHWGGVPGRGQPDPNVWDFTDGDGNPLPYPVLKDDPWPWVSVCPVSTDDQGNEVLGEPRWCKESRVRGSPGWMRPGSRAHTGRFGGGG